MFPKNILIITHRPKKNYGGIAQAYALQKFLRDLGHSVETTTTLGSPYIRYIATNPVLRKILRKGPVQNDEAISRLTQKFIDKNIKQVPLKEAKKKSKVGAYDLYISGSDQVWRAQYSYLPDYLFSFVKSSKAPKISYAASFGKDDLDEFSPSLKRRTRRLAQKFDAISVREESGMSLVETHWGRESFHHVDPTLLLSSSDYDSAIRDSDIPIEPPAGSKIFTYVLDPTDLSRQVISFVEKHLHSSSYKLIEEDLNSGKTLPAFEQWLQSFKDADFVVTDSFHGTVFSIIYKKPFISIGNESRGLARFRSLLTTFSLEHLLILKPDDISTTLLEMPIDWEKVHGILGEERVKSRNYLMRFLQ